MAKYRIVQTHEYSYSAQKQYLGFFWWTLYRDTTLSSATRMLEFAMQAQRSRKAARKFVKQIVQESEQE
tara:strand:+ start:196 stop:402 length:207 start_codon:yes stop_codon:yes gene_type:complete